MSSVPGVFQALATVFLEGLADIPGEGSPFVSVPCCTVEIPRTGAATPDVGLDAVFEPLAWASLLSLAFRELITEKLSRNFCLTHVDDMPAPRSWAFMIITSMLVV